MEKLYDFKISSYYTLLYKDYCELDEQDLLGSHDSDIHPTLTPFYNNLSIKKREFDYDKTFFDEESYVQNYTNLCSLLMFNRFIIVVEKGEDKVTIKLFSYSKNRQPGKKYFRKSTKCHFLTYNFKQNCLYSGTITNYHLKKKCKKTITKNNWFNRQITGFVQVWINYVRGMKLNNFEKIEQSGIEINDAIKIFLSNIPNIDMTIEGYDNVIYKRYLDGIGVKVPNNWINFNRTFPQITKKIFKKNKFKFVDSFMSLNDLHGDKIKRTLHTVKSTEGIESLKFALHLFGKDFILSQPDEIIKTIIESPKFMMNWELHFQNFNIDFNDFTKTELRNVFEIFKLVIVGEINLNSFIDHFSFKTRLKLLEPVLWRSKDYDSFTDEHYTWAEKIGSLSSAEYKRIYDGKFKEYIQTPIDDYYPVLLSDSKEYNIESFIQSNCVRSYVDKPSSLIISLRKGGIDSKVRATIEYRIENDFDKIKLKRVQSLGRYNENLNEGWNRVLIDLDVKMFYTLENNIFKLPEVEIKYGGKLFLSNLLFVEDSAKVQLYNGRTSKLPSRKILIFDNNPVQKKYNQILDLL